MRWEANPETYPNRRITSSVEYMAVVERLLRVCCRNLPGASEDDFESWLPSWSSVGSNLAEDSDSYVAVSENREGTISGGIIAPKLQNAEQAAKDKARSIGLSSEETIYVSNLAFEIKGRGFGTSLMEDLYSFVKGHPTHRYIFLRTDNHPDNQKVLNFYQKHGFKNVGTGVDTDPDKVYFLKDLKPESEVSKQVEKTL